MKPQTDNAQDPNYQSGLQLGRQDRDQKCQQPVYFVDPKSGELRCDEVFLTRAVFEHEKSFAHGYIVGFRPVAN